MQAPSYTFTEKRCQDPAKLLNQGFISKYLFQQI